MKALYLTMASTGHARKTMSSNPPEEHQSQTVSSTPAAAKSFRTKAQGVAVVIGALATAAVAVYGAVRRPEEKLQKLTYEALADKSKEHDDTLKDLTKQVSGISSYLQAMKDYRLLAEVPVTAVASAPAPRRSGAGGLLAASAPPAASVVLRMIPMASSSMAAPEPPAPAPAAPVVMKSLPKFDSLSAEAAGR